MESKSRNTDKKLRLAAYKLSIFMIGMVGALSTTPECVIDTNAIAIGLFILIIVSFIRDNTAIFRNNDFWKDTKVIELMHVLEYTATGILIGEWSKPYGYIVSIVLYLLLAILAHRDLKKEENRHNK